LKKQEIIKGYQTEILYQKHMLENLGRWFSIFLGSVGTGIIVLYFFPAAHLLLYILGIVLIVIGLLGMLVLGYGMYRGNRNLQLVINDFKSKFPAASSMTKAKE
jgi:hypothetical protein